MKLRVLIPTAAGIVAAGAGAAILIAGGGSAASLSASTTTLPKATPSTATTCELKAWADRVEGRPAGFDAHDKGGDYLWHSKDGFHLRVTHRGNDKSVFTGSITASAAIVGIHAVKLEHDDKIWTSADHKTLYFRFVNHGWLDGVDFRTACAATLTVSNLKAGKTVLPTTRVYLGVSKVHPAHVPFTVHREP
jgi:hypothetical protein